MSLRSVVKTKYRLLLCLLAGLLLFVGSISITTSTYAAVGINKQVNFQGRLLNAQGATVPDGNYNVEFKIYQDGDGQTVGDTTGSPVGSLKWTEDWLNANSQGVQIRNGYLSVQLGSITPFGSSVDWNQDTLWLSLNIGSTNVTCTPFSTCTPDGEMIPMKRLSSTPYAINSGLLGGLASSQYVQLAQGLQAEAGNSTNSIFINKTGTGGNFIDLQAGGTDAFTLTSTGDVAFGNNANHSISVTAAGAATTGKKLALTAGAAGTGGTALSGGDLVLQGGTGGGTNGNGGNITIDAGAKNGTGVDGNINIGTNTASTVNIATNASAHTIAIGNGAAVQGITIGSTNSTSSLLLQAGTGNLSIQTQGGTLGIGNNSVAQTLVIGNTTGATGITIQSGSTGISINGATTVTADFTVTNAGNIAFQKGTDFATAGASNNANFGTGALIRLTGATAQTITGITGGTDGRVLALVNAAGQTATLSNLSASSLAANQINTGTGSDLSVPAGGAVALVYDSGASLWRVVGSTASTVGFIQLQATPPPLQQTGSFNISGTGILDTLDSVASGTLNIGTANAATVNIATNASAHTIAIGNGAAVQGITIGSTNSTSSLLLQAGTGNLSIQTQGGTLGIGNNSVAQTLSIGNATGGTSITAFCGTGSCTFGAGAAAHSTTLGTTNTTATTFINAGTGGINIGTSSVANTIQLGTITGAVAQTIAIGNNATAASSTTVTIGNTVAGTITLQSAATINIGQNAAAQTINIGNTAGATGIAELVGTGNYSLDGVAGTAYTLGASTTTGTISIGGTAQTGAITLGSSTGASTVNVANGSGASTINIANVQNAGSVNIGAGMTTGTINIGGTGAQTGSIIIGAGTGVQALSFGTGGTGAKTVTIGSTASTSSLLLQSGTGAVSLQTQAAGSINIGTNNTANTIQIGSTTLSSGTQTISLGNNNTAGGTTNITIGTSSAATAGTTTLQAKGTIVFATNGTTRGTFDSASNTFYFGNGLTATAPNNFVVQGTGSTTTAVAGGSITLQGGNGTVGNANGGNVTLAGGTGIGTGVNGLVVLTTPTFQTAGTQTCAVSCTITQANVDGNSTIVVNATAGSLIITLPSPTIATTFGRVVYVTAGSGSNDFTLRVNGGGTGNDIAMRQNTTATMVWGPGSGTGAWTAAGASSSTTLQAAYDNTLTSAGAAELIVSKTANHDGLTIRDSTSSPVNGNGNGTLLEVQTATAASLFSVNGDVTDFANNGGAESAFSTEWAGIGTGASVSRNTTANFIATGTGSVKITTTGTANTGGKNALTAALTSNLVYNVSFAAKLDTAATGSFTDLNVFYSVDGTTASTACANYSTQTVPTSVWAKINCTITAPAAGITSSNAIFIRQTAAASRSWYIDNFSITAAANLSLATDGGVDDSVNFTTNWTAVSTSTVTRSTTVGNDTSDSAQVVTTAANQGVRNKLSINPFTNTLYRITVYSASTTTGFNTFTVRYSRDGGTSFVNCVDYNTQTISSVTTAFTQVTCYITTDGTAATTPYVYFTQTDATGRTFYVDTFSMNISTNAVPNVQIGGGVYGGPVTLFTLDRAASAPIANNNDSLLGSMYYDTTLGKLQCYEADGWGACGSSPDNIITISPEYTNAVLHGTGIGTMTSDICSDALNINDGSGSPAQPTICGTNETFNFYKWTSPQASPQTYSIYVTYQLPTTFKTFTSGQTSLMGRTDSTNSTVQYSVYRNNTGTGLTQCGSTVPVSTGVVTSWQTGIASGAADPSTCGFGAGDSIVFKIDVIASQNANAYVGNLGFTFSNK